MNNTFLPRVQRVAQSYVEHIGPTTFANLQAQVLDALRDDVKSVLIIGKGVGLEVPVLQQLGCSVTTADIDIDLAPNFIASVDHLPVKTRGFDLVICAHVLEHLPFSRFEPAVAELRRIARYALVYLPISGVTFMLKLELKPFLSFTRLFHKAPIRGRHKFDGEHYWEINKKGSRLADVRRILLAHFQVEREYQNPDWLYSYNFVLKARD